MNHRPSPRRRHYEPPALRAVRVRTSTPQLAQVDAQNNCTAHLHNDATVAVDATTCCNF